MLIIMSKSASDEEVESILEQIRTMGASEGFVSKGQFHTVIGVVGDPDRVAELPLTTYPGVERIQRVTQPYKLVSHLGHPGTSTVPINGTSIGPGHFTLIAGPCAIESAEQAMAAAKAAKAAGAHVLRGDAYKPRTSPYSFQGLAEEGLRIMSEIRSDLELPVVMEVLDPSQVEKVAAVADVIRIGTRNMQNFSLLSAAGQTGKPIMLKRGMTATIEEWLMAAEYVAKSGNSRIILCERGIRTFETATRNTLDISAVAVVREESHLPVIVDPSHAVGQKKLVAPLARAAVAAGADGVMIDVHTEPEKALCDGPQALSSADLMELSADLKALANQLGRSF